MGYLAKMTYTSARTNVYVISIIRIFRNAYFILAAINAMIREGIENTHTNTVYKKAKVAMAGKAKVYKILKMMCPVVKGRFSLGIRLYTGL